jgi:hypothetical protein
VTPNLVAGAPISLKEAWSEANFISNLHKRCQTLLKPQNPVPSPKHTIDDERPSATILWRTREERRSDAASQTTDDRNHQLPPLTPPSSGMPSKNPALSQKTGEKKPPTSTAREHHAGAEVEELKKPHNNLTHNAIVIGAGLQATYSPEQQDHRHRKSKHHHQHWWRANPRRK